MLEYFYDLFVHYANMPMQYAEILKALKMVNFRCKKCDIFLFFAQNIDCEYR